jgi:hypothetical protein
VKLRRQRISKKRWRIYDGDREIHDGHGEIHDVHTEIHDIHSGIFDDDVGIYVQRRHLLALVRRCHLLVLVRVEVLVGDGELWPAVVGCGGTVLVVLVVVAAAATWWWRWWWPRPWRSGGGGPRRTASGSASWLLTFFLLFSKVCAESYTALGTRVPRVIHLALGTGLCAGPAVPGALCRELPLGTGCAESIQPCAEWVRLSAEAPIPVVRYHEWICFVRSPTSSGASGRTWPWLLELATLGSYVLLHKGQQAMMLWNP